VNSDAVAVEVAEAVHAMKFLYLSAAPQLEINGEPVRQLSIVEAEDLAKRRRASVAPALLSKVDHAARACRQGIPRVHLLNGNANEALLAEVFSPDGVGTMVYSNEYQQIRRLFKKDVRSVMALIRESVSNEELVRRTRSEILGSLDDYWVLEVDRNLIACVALHFYPEAAKAELACLYVAKSHEGQGYGRKLMAYVEQVAAGRGANHVFALSTQAYNYFQQKGGFVEAKPDILPPERRKKYEVSGRKSKILIKPLAPAVSTEGVRAAGATVS
jgi:amino-acid N-acetyltransferase